MNELIKNKINELYNTTPEYVSVAWGKKKINGIYTDENCFIFMVEEKKPLSEIPQNEILPTLVEVDGSMYKTDVWNNGKINIIPCQQNVLDECYGWENLPPTNQNRIRPLKGGLSITSKNTQSYVGTLGLIAVDVATDGLVGVTNAHVQVGNMVYTNERELGNEDTDETNLTYQSGELGTSIPENAIGETIRYTPISFKRINQLDAALIYLYSRDVSFTESFKQHGLSYNLPMPFANSFEIDNLLNTNPKIYSSGRTTGAKETDPCGLMITATNAIIYIGGYTKDEEKVAEFNNIICFDRMYADCSSPVSFGDSGSALIADFNGVWKIIGLVFAGGSNSGCACRIDTLSAELGIKEWDGTPKKFINPRSKEKITFKGGNGNKRLVCNQKVYWQIGATFNSTPCR